MQNSTLSFRTPPRFLVLKTPAPSCIATPWKITCQQGENWNYGKGTLSNQMTVTYLQPFVNSAIPLKEFHNLLINEYRGQLILSVTTPNQIELSYDVRSALKKLEFAHPIVSLLNELITKIPYGPNSLGLLLSYTLQKILQYCSYDLGNTSRIVPKLLVIKTLTKPLFENEIQPVTRGLVDNLNLSVLSFYQPKLSTSFNNESIHSLTKQTVASVCSSINFDMGLSGKIFVTPFQANSTCFSVKGLTIDLHDRLVDRAVINNLKNDLKIQVLLVFDSIDDESYDNLLHIATDRCIKIVVCQKLIGPACKVQFRRRGILALERVGQEFMTTLMELSGATVDSCGLLIGYLTRVQLGVKGFDSLLLLENSSAFVVTLCVAYDCSLITHDQLKSVIGQALKLAYSIINGSSSLSLNALSEQLASIRSPDNDIRALFDILSDGVNHWESALSLCNDAAGASTQSWPMSKESLEFIINSLINILNVGLIVKKM